MGVHGLPAELPCGQMTKQIKGFSNLDKQLKTQRGGRKVDLDTGTLVHVFAWMTKVPFNNGNCLPAVKLFQYELKIFNRIYNMDVTSIFEGRSPRRNHKSTAINSPEPEYMSTKTKRMKPLLEHQKFIQYPIQSSENLGLS